jgi:pimeloyl-ACP methyl ester carboxylesterase
MFHGPVAAAIVALALPASAGAQAHRAQHRQPTHAHRRLNHRGGGPPSPGPVTPGYGVPPHAVPFGQTASDLATYGELFAPTQLEGANVPCTPSAAHPYPVVLVHGTLADMASNWVTLAPLLANLGYCVYALNYGDTNASGGGRVEGLGDIPTSAQQLSGFVEQVLAETGASKVDIVGHSQGGMMPNYYIRFLGGAAKVHTLIGLAPSNHGTTEGGLVTMLQANPILAAITHDFLDAIQAPALYQQEVGSTVETETFAGGDTVPGPRYVVIETALDEVVTPYTNALLHGRNVTDILVQGQCPDDPVEHIGLFDDWPALQNVVNQLSAHPAPNFEATCTDYGQNY